MLGFYIAKRRTLVLLLHDEYELEEAVCDTSLATTTGGNGDDIFSNAANDTSLANIEAWKLLGGLLS